MEMSGQLHYLATLSPPPPHYMVDRRLDGAQNWSARGGKEKTASAMNWISVTHPTASLYTNLTIQAQIMCYGPYFLLFQDHL
jgi:hypothetical protein